MYFHSEAVRKEVEVMLEQETTTINRTSIFGLLRKLFSLCQ